MDLLTLFFVSLGCITASVIIQILMKKFSEEDKPSKEDSSTKEESSSKSTNYATSKLGSYLTDSSNIDEEDDTEEESEMDKCDRCGIEQKDDDEWEYDSCPTCIKLVDLSEMDADDDDNENIKELIKDAETVVEAIDNDDIDKESFKKTRDAILAKKKELGTPVDNVMRKYGVQ